MGSIVSRVRLATRVLRALSVAYDELSMKVAASPGIPVDNPSTPYWAIPPSPIACHGAKDPLPGIGKDRSATLNSDSDYYDADVVIIGSGITGTAVARTLLDWDARRVREQGGAPIRVVMLEARDTCSGATARNGGHITPPLYHDYTTLKKEFGAATAQRIIRFRLAHLDEFLRVAEAEGLLVDSQARKVQTFDVFFDRKLFVEAKEKLEEYKKDMPEESESYGILDAEDGVNLVEEYQLSPGIVGCITTTAGAVHPYRLVTGILSRLLADYSNNFQLYTHTPCLGIDSDNDSSLYTLTTPKGTLRTPHIVHATNGWVAHLLEPLRGKIIPLRATMTSQRPGKGLGALPPTMLHKSGSEKAIEDDVEGENWLGSRSFVFYPGSSANIWDYLTQMPAPPSPSGSPASLRPWDVVFHHQRTQSGLDSTSPRSESPASDTDVDGDTAFASSSSDTDAEQEHDDKLDSEMNHLSIHPPLSPTSPSPQSNLSPASNIAPPNDSRYPPPAAELMFGGGLGQTTGAFLDSAGNADDRSYYLPTGSYLSGALPLYFSGWGEEGRDGETSSSSSCPSKGHRGTSDNDKVEPGRLKSVWSGILGMSADGMPWVGRLPEKISGRPAPQQHSLSLSPTSQVIPVRKPLAAPGEWIAAGYTGEGMVHAWMSAKAVAYMILNADEERERRDPLGNPTANGQDWLPTPYLVTEKRWKEADMDKLLEAFMP